jgi:N-acetylmuramoyl-L-alanine amidase
MLLVFCFLETSFTSKFVPFYGVKTIVIDAGHGGKDPGCHGTKYKEKDVALAVALKFGKYIEENLKDVRVIYTRKTDVFVELQERVEIANRAKADLFVSIHCNSACVRDKKLKRDVCRDQVHGAETYVMGIKNENGKLNIAKRENSAILLEDNYVKKYEGFDPNSDESYIIMSMFADTYLDQSLNFASKVQKQYCEKIGRADKGVKRASLWVLWRTYMPSLLTEIGYLTNLQEEHFLGSVKGQEYIASGLFRAFREYKDELEGTVKKYDDEFEHQVRYTLCKADSLEIESAQKVLTPVKPDTAAVEKENTNVKDTVKKVANTNTSSVIKTPVPEKKLETSKLQPKVDEVKKQVLVYKVQLLSSDKKIPFNSEQLKKVEILGEYIENGFYKYTSGQFLSFEEANIMKQKLRKLGFKDAFVIGMQNGKRVPIKQ